MTERRRRQVGAAAGVASVVAFVVGAFVTRGGANHPGYVPDPVTMAAEGRSANYASMRVERTFEEPEGEVEWTVVSYEASDGPCLDIYGEAVSGADEGKLSSCGRFEGPFRWSIGGVEVGNEWYNVAYGRGTPGAEKMRITLGDGTQIAPHIARGTWVAIVPGWADDFDITLLEAVNPEGRVVESVRPTSIAELRAGARQAGDHHHSESP